MNRFEQDHKPLELHPLSTAQLSNCQLNLWALPSARAFATRRPTHILFRAQTCRSIPNADSFQQHHNL